MALVDFSEKPETIKTRAGDILIYPVSMEDLASILDNHRELIETMIEVDRKERITPYTFVQKFPAIVNDVLLLALRAEANQSNLAIIKKYPIGVTVKCILSVWNQMEVDIQELGNVINGFTENLNRLSARLPPERTPVDGPLPASKV